MAWDEIVFLQPSHFVRHELFGSVIISFRMFWGIILLGTKTSFCRQSRRFVLQNAPPKVTMVIPQGMHIIASAGMAMSMSIIIACHFIPLLLGGNGNENINLAFPSISLQLY